MLDEASPSKYSVTNFGATGTTMMKKPRANYADSPWWNTNLCKRLTAAKWDIIIIMLGTNDAKDAGSHGPHNWPHTCTGPAGLEQGCQLRGPGGSTGPLRAPSRTPWIVSR